MKRLIVIIIGLIVVFTTYPIAVMAVDPGEINENTIDLEYRNVTVYAPAVASTNNGYIGVISTITVTIQNNGNGRVFVDTLPLTQIDMQGSARLAVKVASALVKKDQNIELNPDNYDYFFVVRTSAPIIGGPSAGAIMTVAVISLLENWQIDNETVMTGMINPDGSIGPVGGITKKIDAANSVGAKRFIVPKGQMTYVETITETTTSNGWQQIISKPVIKNVSDYALDNYEMDVVEAEDINDALLYFTGYQFPIVESDDMVTTEDYISSMKPLSTNLLNDARESYKKASDSFNETQIPNQWPNYYRNRVTDVLNDGRERLVDSENWYNLGVYYTSTSKSFQSLIDSHFVTYACEYFNKDQNVNYIQELIDSIQVVNNNKSSVAKNSEINGMISLQCVGAAQKRASDANSFLSEAQTDFQNGDYLTSLYKTAYAEQRSESIDWWLGIPDYYNDTGDITTENIINLAEAYIEDAQQAIVYSGVILQEVGGSTNYLTDAESLIQQARDEKENGYYAAALFESLESLVKANLALELVDSTSEEKIDRARESASTSISEARSQGIEPVLAISYYEYAESLANETSLDSALIYYRYCDIIAGALTFTSTSDSGSSRYIGIPEIDIPIWSRGLFKYLDIFLFFSAIAFILGLGIGLSYRGIKPRKLKEEKPKIRYKQQSIDDYYKKQNKYFSNKDIPRSIRDYYKKKK